MSKWSLGLSIAALAVTFALAIMLYFAGGQSEKAIDLRFIDIYLSAITLILTAVSIIMVLSIALFTTFFFRQREEIEKLLETTELKIARRINEIIRKRGIKTEGENKPVKTSTKKDNHS